MQKKKPKGFYFYLSIEETTFSTSCASVQLVDAWLRAGVHWPAFVVVLA